MKFNVRAFIDNPGGAYDPAPLHEFDDELEFVPDVGDILRWDHEGTSYKVTKRMFEYSSSRCALWVVETEDSWPM